MELERFYQAKQAEITALEKLGQDAVAPWPAPRPSFSATLKKPCPGPLPVIAEFKRASPSRGMICSHVEPEDAARQYAENGASAISVLTEEAWFKGHLSYLSRIAATNPGIPMLRKDFLFHPAQIAATLGTPASALLLIVRLTPDARVLRELREQAEQGGVEAVVEIFGEKDLDIARESGARIIQVNARDLETLNVDARSALRFIREHRPEKEELWIAASGMTCREDLAAAAEAGYHAALVGSALMEEGTPGESLRRMLTEKPGNARVCGMTAHAMRNGERLKEEPDHVN